MPLTRKEDYIADPEAFRLRPDDLPADFSTEERVLWDVAYTTGTTSGRPSPFYNTAHDAYAIWDQARRCNEAEGLTAADRVANLYPLAGFPTGAFLSVIRSGMVVGFPVAHGLTGAANSEFKVRNSLAEAVATIARFRPTVLWGVPSFIRRFLDEAERGAAPISRDVRLVLTSGEPMPAALRAELREQLARLGAGLRSRSAPATRSPRCRAAWCNAPRTREPQNLCPDLYHLEVVDPATGRRLPDGESGMLAITHLHRRGTVLLRYLVGDIVTLERERRARSAAGEGERVVATPRRTGSLVKCRGMLVNTDVILDTLSALPGIGQFQIVFAAGGAAGRDGAAGDPHRAGRRRGGASRRDDVIAARARGGVAAPRGRVRGARRALRPRALDQGQARARPAHKNGLNEDCMDPNAAGKSFPPYEFHVERGKIREFADAIGDPNPIYRDPAYAAKSALRRHRRAADPAAHVPLRAARGVGGAARSRTGATSCTASRSSNISRRSFAGDVLTAQDRIVSITEKESRRAGKLQIAVIETTFHNQRGEKVQVARRTLVETGKRISE